MQWTHCQGLQSLRCILSHTKRAVHPEARGVAKNSAHIAVRPHLSLQLTKVLVPSIVRLLHLLIIANVVDASVEKIHVAPLGWTYRKTFAAHWIARIVTFADHALILRDAKVDDLLDYPCGLRVVRCLWRWLLRRWRMSHMWRLTLWLSLAVDYRLRMHNGHWPPC